MLRRMLLIPQPENEYSNQLAKILADTSMSEDVKLKEYSQILQRYLRHSKKEPEPIRVKYEPEPVLESKDEDSEDEENKPDILTQFPKVYQKKAAAVLQRLSAKNISWLPNGNVVRRGKVIPFSDIQKIVLHAVKRKSSKTVPPIGYKTVSNVLNTNWETY